MRTFYTDGTKNIELPQYPDSAWTFYTEPPEDQEDEFYGLVAMVFRAVNMTADALASLPFVILRGKTEVDTSDDWQNVVKFMPEPADLLRRWRMALFMSNSAYGFMETRPALLRYIVTNTVTPKADEKNGITAFTRKIGNRKVDYPYEQGSTKNRIIPLFRLDHTTELLPSKSTEFKALMQAAGILYYTDFFVQSFFKRGGVIPSIIGVKGIPTPTAQEKIERGISKLIRNAYKYVAQVWNAEAITVTPLGQGVDALQKTTLYTQAIQNVAAAAGMPLSLLLSNSATYATAIEEKKTWFNNKIVPDAKQLQTSLNRELFEPYGYRLEFRYEATDEGQQEEVQRATSISTFMDFLNKCPTADIALETANTFGYELTDGLIAAIEAYYKQKEERAEEMAENMSSTDNEQQEPGREQLGDTSGPPRPPAPPPVRSLTLDHLKELQVWRDVALRRNKKGEGLDFEYQPHYGGLPDDITVQVKAALDAATTDADIIKACFDVDAMVIEQEEKEKKENPDIKVLAAAINALADSESRRVEMPYINITTPPTSFILNEKAVTVQPAEVKQEAPVVNVNVDPTPIQNNINVEPTPVTVDNKVEIKPPAPKRARVRRDAQGRIDGIEAE